MFPHTTIYRITLTSTKCVSLYLDIKQWLPSQTATQVNSAFQPYRVCKLAPSSAGKGKSRHGSFRWWMNVGCAGKTDPLRTLAIPECLRGVFSTRRYTNPHLPYLCLYLWL